MAVPINLLSSDDGLKDCFGCFEMLSILRLYRSNIEPTQIFDQRIFISS